MSERLYSLLKLAKCFIDEGKMQRASFDSLLCDPTASREALNNSLSTWSHWYSLSFLEFLLFFAEASGLDSLISAESKNASKAELQEKFLDEVQNKEINIGALSDEYGEEAAKSIMLQLCFVLDFNQRAMARRNRSINDMLAQIREKVDDYEEIIFEAISIDKSVVTNFEIAEHISRWTICNETKLLKKLSKAIAGKYPRNSRMVGLDDHRYMTAILKDISGEPTPQMVNEMNQRLKTMAEGDDPIRQIRNHLDIRARDTRKTKRKSSS